MRRDELAGDHCPHRVTHDMRSTNIEMIEQVRHVLDHCGAVSCYVMRLVAFAVPAAIERDHAEVLGELFNGTEHSPAANASREAVEENYRFAVSDVDVAN